jgi:hypothetical protein
MSSARPWSPAEKIAIYDQEIAATDAEIDRLLKAYQIGIAEAGEPQAMASMMLLVAEWDKPELAALLMVAVRRLCGNIKSETTGETR